MTWSSSKKLPTAEGGGYGPGPCSERIVLSPLVRGVGGQRCSHTSPPLLSSRCPALEMRLITSFLETKPVIPSGSRAQYYIFLCFIFRLIFYICKFFIHF